MSRVLVGDTVVGDAAPAFLIVEAGVNHNGLLTEALKLVDCAADAGADAVKFQAFNAGELTVATAPLAEYQAGTAGAGENQRSLLAGLQLTAADFELIAERCRSRSILFLATPFDLANAEMLRDLGVPAFKVGSGDLTNHPFLAGLGAFGLPLLISTGMSTMDEVAEAVDVVARTETPIVLLHCVSSYPAPPEEANLRVIDALRARFDVPVGYSDHCLDRRVALAAVARGASVIERHFTLDRSQAGPDHGMSMDPGELVEFVEELRALEAWLGDGQKVPQASELELRAISRRSIVAARELPRGAVLTGAMLALKRPGDGMPPSRLGHVLGRRLLRPLAADERLREEDLEPKP